MRVTLYNRGECHLAQWESLDDFFWNYSGGHLVLQDGDKLTFEENETETENRSKT